MAALTLTDEAARLFEGLVPELRKLCANASSHCDLRLIATIHDFEIGLVSLGIDTKRKIMPRTDRGGAK